MIKAGWIQTIKKLIIPNGIQRRRRKSRRNYTVFERCFTNWNEEPDKISNIEMEKHISMST
jgi:hypothetical protein